MKLLPILILALGACVAPPIEDHPTHDRDERIRPLRVGPDLNPSPWVETRDIIMSDGTTVRSVKVIEPWCCK